MVFSSKVYDRFHYQMKTRVTLITAITIIFQLIVIIFLSEIVKLILGFSIIVIC